MRLTLLTIFLLGSLILLVNSQGESCTTQDSHNGVCIKLPQCKSLIKRYIEDLSQNTVDILRKNEASCGNKKVEGNPLVCCSDNVPQKISLDQQIDQYLKTSCITPNNTAGYCINLKECPSELNKFIQLQKDPEYVKYIRESNQKCNSKAQVICCPLDGAPSTQPDGEVVTRSGLLNQSQCGVSKVTHDRVVGGVPAKLGAWPWMALLGERTFKESDFVIWWCGGSIITSRHILTAAHCALKLINFVRLGEHDLSTNTETKTVDIGIKEKIKHPNYDKSDKHSDVAVFVLESEIKFSTTISPICLPLDNAEKSKNLIGRSPYAAGWGHTEFSGKNANVLQQIQLPVISNVDCKKSYSAKNLTKSFKQFDIAVICAGYDEGGRDTCQGDSGGPLMMPFLKDGKYNYYQVGIVSYGHACALAKTPGIYARVSTFSNWIKSIVEST